MNLLTSRVNFCWKRFLTSTTGPLDGQSSQVQVTKIDLSIVSSICRVIEGEGKRCHGITNKSTYVLHLLFDAKFYEFTIWRQ